jgi:hypothetical protein
MPKGRARESSLPLRETAFGDLVPRFSAERVRAASVAGRIARAVSEALKDCDFDREHIAREMSAYLGEQVTKAMLDAYASQAREEHNIPAHRLVALAVIAGDARLLNSVLDGTGFIAVDGRFEALLKRERAIALREELEREIAEADAEWRAKR